MDTLTATNVRLERSELLRRGVVTLAVTLLAVAAVRGLAGLVVPLDGIGPMTWPAVLGSSAVGVLGGTLVYAVLVRFLDRPDRAFLALATVVLVGSLVPVVFFAPTLPGVTTAVVGLMAVLHVVVAAAVVGGLTGVGR